jgi:hypothetical protein
MKRPAPDADERAFTPFPFIAMDEGLPWLFDTFSPLPLVISLQCAAPSLVAPLSAYNRWAIVTCSVRSHTMHHQREEVLGAMIMGDWVAQEF